MVSTFTFHFPHTCTDLDGKLFSSHINTGTHTTTPGSKQKIYLFSGLLICVWKERRQYFPQPFLRHSQLLHRNLVNQSFTPAVIMLGWIVLSCSIPWEGNAASALLVCVGEINVILMENVFTISMCFWHNTFFLKSVYWYYREQTINITEIVLHEHLHTQTRTQ